MECTSAVLGDILAIQDLLRSGCCDGETSEAMLQKMEQIHSVVEGPDSNLDHRVAKDEELEKSIESETDNSESTSLGHGAAKDEEPENVIESETDKCETTSGKEKVSTQEVDSPQMGNESENVATLTTEEKFGPETDENFKKLDESEDTEINVVEEDTDKVRQGQSSDQVKPVVMEPESEGKQVLVNNGRIQDPSEVTIVKTDYHSNSDTDIEEYAVPSKKVRYVLTVDVCISQRLIEFRKTPI